MHPAIVLLSMFRYININIYISWYIFIIYSVYICASYIYRFFLPHYFYLYTIYTIMIYIKFIMIYIYECVCVCAWCTLYSLYSVLFWVFSKTSDYKLHTRFFKETYSSRDGARFFGLSRMPEYAMLFMNLNRYD